MRRLFPEAHALLRTGFRAILGELPEEYWVRLGRAPAHEAALPLLLYGDEANAIGTSWMVLTWQSAVCPAASDSVFSRHVITLIPKTHYVIRGQINVTLQEAIKCVVRSLCALAQKGVHHNGEQLFCEVVGLKGDWKFHVQSCCLTRSYGRKLVCHLCMGSKTLAAPVTDVGPDALWRQTLLDPNSPPWSQEPALAAFRGFNPSWIWPDPLHVYFLGTGRDLAGSVLVILLRVRGFFAGPNQADRMEAATAQFKRWIEQSNLAKLPRKWSFSKPKLNWKSGTFASLRDKGSRTSSVLLWLADLLDGRDCGDNLLRTCVWAANNVIGLLASAAQASPFLTDAEAEQVKTVGQIFMQTYVALHLQHRGEAVKLFQFRPKAHLLQHLLLLHVPGNQTNPWLGVCWMDEDLLKKLMAVLRKTHVVTAPVQTLRRWLLQLPAKYQAVLLARLHRA